MPGALLKALVMGAGRKAAQKGKLKRPALLDPSRRLSHNPQNSPLLESMIDRTHMYGRAGDQIAGGPRAKLNFKQERALLKLDKTNLSRTQKAVKLVLDHGARPAGAARALGLSPTSSSLQMALKKARGQ
jgi:hypothetical protein